MPLNFRYSPISRDARAAGGRLLELTQARTYGNGASEMRVLLTTYGSRGDVEPLGLAVQLQALGAEVPVCELRDFAEPLARIGVPLVPVGQPVRPLVTGAAAPSAADLPRRAAELVAAQFDRSPRRPRDVMR